MIDIVDIRSTITSGVYTVSELESIAQAVKFARAQLAQQQIRSCVKGDSVKFTNPKTGTVFRGTVDRVKIKNVIVSTPQGRYNVPANLLEFA
jgi:uncharacterized Fe-S cluster protein YjdI